MKNSLYIYIIVCLGKISTKLFVASIYTVQVEKDIVLYVWKTSTLIFPQRIYGTEYLGKVTPPIQFHQ